MGISYQFDREAVQISEKPNVKDREFLITALDRSYVARIHAVRDFFEHNTIYTDVLFYTQEDYNYQAIVRTDYYIDFILQLFKHKIIAGLKWT